VPTCLPGSDGRSRSDAAPLLYGFHGELIGLAQRLGCCGRWQAIIASTSNGRKRKSPIILTTSNRKSSASLCVSHRSVPVQGGVIHCALHNNSYIGPLPVESSPLLAAQQNQAGSGSPLPRGRCSGASHRSIRRRRASNTAIVRRDPARSSPRQTPLSRDTLLR